jgi:hypothetical protein
MRSFLDIDKKANACYNLQQSGGLIMAETSICYIQNRELTVRWEAVAKTTVVSDNCCICKGPLSEHDSDMMAVEVTEILDHYQDVSLNSSLGQKVVNQFAGQVFGTHILKDNDCEFEDLCYPKFPEMIDASFAEQ